MDEGAGCVRPDPSCIPAKRPSQLGSGIALFGFEHAIHSWGQQSLFCLDTAPLSPFQTNRVLNLEGGKMHCCRKPLAALHAPRRPRSRRALQFERPRCTFAVVFFACLPLAPRSACGAEYRSSGLGRFASTHMTKRPDDTTLIQPWHTDTELFTNNASPQRVGIHPASQPCVTVNRRSAKRTSSGLPLHLR